MVQQDTIIQQPTQQQQQTNNSFRNLSPDTPASHHNRTTYHSIPRVSLDASFDFTHHQEEHDDQEIIEDSIREPELPDRILADVPVKFTVIEQATQRGRIKLVSSDGYEYTRKVKQVSLNDIHKPSRRIVDDSMLKHIEPDDYQLPKVHNLKRTANRVREELRPAEPTSLDFQLDKEYLRCDEFLVDDIRIDGERHLVFATHIQLQLLKYSKKWYCDGTFKIVKDPFVQLWSIHAFIKKGDSLKQVPLVFVLMSRRKTKDYIKVHNSVKEKIGVLHVECFCLDFEKGLWKAIRQIFPLANIKGCAFHFSQAIWRKFQDLGLRTTYTKRGTEYRYVRSLLSLPFLPHADITPAFNTLKDRANSNELRELVPYINTSWFEGPYWFPKTWSVYQHSIRTNNDVEGWHKRINNSKSNVSFYILIPELRREAELVDLTPQRLVSEEQVLRDQRRRYRDLEGRLHQFWEDCDNGEMTVAQLLRECSKVYGPSHD